MNNSSLKYRVVGLIDDLKYLKSAKESKKVDVLKQYSAQSEKDIVEIIEKKESELEKICLEIKDNIPRYKRNYHIEESAYKKIGAKDNKSEYKDVVEAAKTMLESNEEILNLYNAYKGKQIANDSLKSFTRHDNPGSTNQINYFEMTVDNTRYNPNANCLDERVKIYLSNWPKPINFIVKEPQIMSTLAERYHNKTQ